MGTLQRTHLLAFAYNPCSRHETTGRTSHCPPAGDQGYYNVIIGPKPELIPTLATFASPGKVEMDNCEKCGHFNYQNLPETLARVYA